MTPMMRSNRWLTDMFNDLFDTRFLTKVTTSYPATNVSESETGYTVELAVPGAQKEDFDVQINDEGHLHIKLEKKSEQKEEDAKRHYLRREFSQTTFEKVLALPEDVEKEQISAKVENGVLLVQLPKIEQKPEPKLGRKVEIA